jgi:L-ascorbate metabolism protein UlaG (beta-lactamase superfamily)
MTRSDPEGRAPGSPALPRRRLVGLLAALPGGLWAARGKAATPADGRPWHHLPDGTFRNPPGSPTRGGDFGDWLRFFRRRLGAQPPPPALPSGHVLPEAEVLAGLDRVAGKDSITWLGHASFLIRLGGRTILTDPFLSRRASPLARLGPARYAGPGLAPERLPPIDLLLLSHNHYDHLDLAALERLPAPERATLVMPLRVGRYLDAARFARAIELDWWQTAEVMGLAVAAVPAIHFSQRGPFDRNASLWCGFHLGGGGRSVLFAGDTAYGPVFREELAARLPPPDLLLAPIGAYARAC